MAFTLDTSGAVNGTSFNFSHGAAKRVTWPDLSPFEQGYVEALFDERDFDPRGPSSSLGFSDLAPETLATIRKDCATRLAQAAPPYPNTIEDGRKVWEKRQAGKLRDHGFPPLTVTLGDDGKVRFA